MGRTTNPKNPRKPSGVRPKLSLSRRVGIRWPMRWLLKKSIFLRPSAMRNLPLQGPYPGREKLRSTISQMTTCDIPYFWRRAGILSLGSIFSRATWRKLKNIRVAHGKSVPMVLLETISVRSYEKQGHKPEAMRTYAVALGEPIAQPETRQRLIALLGSDAEVDQISKKAAADLQLARTVQLSNKSGIEGSADFGFLLAPGQNVRAVKFISGEESLKEVLPDLEALKPPDYFPEATDSQLLRRGKLSCSRTPSAQCSLLFVSAETVRLTN
jgi:hypothetical protein